VCLAVETEHNIIAVGSQHFVTFLDPRSSSIIHKAPSQDQDWGVRSLSCKWGTVVTVGGGMGRISFFDLQKNSYREVVGVKYLETGHGWLHKDATYRTHFASVFVPNAVYTHCYDPSGTKIFAGGGPLMLGLKGAYAAVW